MLLIPAIDIVGGRCVQFYHGNLSQTTRYTPTPATVLKRYEALGATWVHIVDLDGARYGLRSEHDLIAALSSLTALHLQVGGGVRSASDIELLLNIGIARVVIGSVALERPRDVIRWLQEFGPERICLAFDVRSTGLIPQVRAHGWATAHEISLWEALAPYRSRVKHVLCTDIDRDGTLFGPNLMLYRQAVVRFPEFSWQASGGIRNAVDLHALRDAGVASAICGNALLEERIPLTELKLFLPGASFPVSTSATAG